ncbi:MAG: DUF1972 domain-containing protein [Novosphingobium sp.]
MKLAIVGSVGLPAKYGGFETLVENLALHHDANRIECAVTVYCSAKFYADRPDRFHNVELKYIPLGANGPQSIPYDIVSMFSALWNGADVILVLGVSGAIAIPLLRLLGSARVVTNVDGIEWKRAKWRSASRWFLRLSERIAAKWSHVVIADNAEIAKHIMAHYGVACNVIPYGGDHVLATCADDSAREELPSRFALAICRIEPENNVAMIVEAFARQPAIDLVFVGNWSASAYGLGIREHFAGIPHLHLLDPVYDAARLKSLREGASVYIHGHSAGGTNPSLVEAMHCHDLVLAFDCGFNRSTTEGAAHYFRDCNHLGTMLAQIADGTIKPRLGVLKEIADRRYRWEIVARQYFDIIS